MPNVPIGIPTVRKVCNRKSTSKHQNEVKLQSILLSVSAGKSQIEVEEETLSRSVRDPHFQRLTGLPPKGATSQVMVALACDHPKASLSDHRDIGMLLKQQNNVGIIDHRLCYEQDPFHLGRKTSTLHIYFLARFPGILGGLLKKTREGMKS
jgi:hypothetical protein